MEALDVMYQVSDHRTHKFKNAMKALEQCRRQPNELVAMFGRRVMCLAAEAHAEDDVKIQNEAAFRVFISGLHCKVTEPFLQEFLDSRGSYKNTTFSVLLPFE